MPLIQKYFEKKRGAAANKPDVKAIIKSANKVPKAVKNRICKLYFARQNLMHTARFLQWILVNKAGEITKAQVNYYYCLTIVLERGV